MVEMTTEVKRVGAVQTTLTVHRYAAYSPPPALKNVWRWGYTAYWEPDVGRMRVGSRDRGFKTKAEARAAGQAWLDEQEA